jgi:NADPH:quinone reductase-like Zn-dependent oxidoreductase
MKTWQLAKGFGLANLALVEESPRPLASHEVRVRIKACSLNYRDLLVIKGLYNPSQTLPFIPVSDGSGEVIEIGDQVRDFALGDRVCALFSQTWQRGRVFEGAQKSTLGSPLAGMLREEGVFSESGLIKFPTYLSFEEAATLPCAGVTAFNALVYEAQLKPGDLIVLEGTGGVSLFALQFAQALGCLTIITSAHSDKLKKCLALGATHIVNYQENPAWAQRVLEINKYGADAVIEVGGAQTFNQAIQATRRGGIICLIGIVSGTMAQVDLRPLLMKQIRVQGIFVGSRAVFESMNRVLEHSAIHPVISQVFAFEQAPAAFSYLESGQHMGKIVITMDS